MPQVGRKRRILVTHLLQAEMKRKHMTHVQQVDLQLHVTEGEILIPSLRVIQGKHMKHMKQINVLLGKNLMEHVVFQQNHSVVLSLLFRINGIHPV
ncbi:MAG: hypothetical protein SCABRO_01363 [Candidatus Scalindua brodae]|uniref:Uncharacterized protein n=1 Tax=Candidatus Scalindua brodae TaxID=237368 RepID=A0A0B0EK66_9BACT|nr:MAG: hypothetical protein SCABRO_01363 [Candidatus Scalindua brodae]